MIPGPRRSDIQDAHASCRFCLRREASEALRKMIPGPRRSDIQDAHTSCRFCVRRARRRLLSSRRLFFKARVFIDEEEIRVDEKRNLSRKKKD
ncbi:hypothetical protein V6N13_076855 [Hibiscus sabdariffa]|uniref:Uncharacterized protein n=1 Tax=Hibiscus sabdariffa TaxID=183260 RepID=A0ABR2CM53_9ROSI